MDIVIPLGKGSRCEDLELKYCLRSIEKNFSNVGTVVIVGDKPAWRTKNIYYIRFEESNNNHHRAQNICQKILAACSVGITDNFLFMNDDHFILGQYDLYYFPFYHRGPFNLTRLRNHPSQLIQTQNTINRFGSKMFDYDIHCPIIYNKERFINTFRGLKFPEYGYCLKSYYMALNKRHSILTKDLKFIEPLRKEEILAQVEGRSWFSTGDAAMVRGEMIKALEQLYPQKSRYEY